MRETSPFLARHNRLTQTLDNSSPAWYNARMGKKEKPVPMQGVAWVHLADQAYKVKCGRRLVEVRTRPSRGRVTYMIREVHGGYEWSLLTPSTFEAVLLEWVDKLSAV